MATGATVPVRSDTIRAPAVTAAVSARSTLSPKPTVGRPDVSSALLHPPSGPTATTRCAAWSRSPLSWASTTSPDAPSSASWSKPLDRGAPARGAPADDAAFAHQRHDAIDPELGELLDDPLGALPLRGGEGHGQRRGWRLFELHGAVAAGPGLVTHGCEVSRLATLPHGARPPARTVTDDDLFARPQPEDAGQVMDVVGRDTRVRRIVDEDLRRRRGARRDGGDPRRLRPSQRRSGGARTRRPHHHHRVATRSRPGRRRTGGATPPRRP